MRRIKLGKDSKTVVSNFSYLLLLQVAGYVFPLITMPYLARVIGVDGFGKIAFASAIIMYFQTIADWGFTLTATRDIAKVRADSSAVEKIFSVVTWARLFIMSISLIFLCLMIWLIPLFRQQGLIILLTFLLIPGHILFPEWLFQGMEKMRNITILNFLAKLIFTASVFIFIRKSSDYILQPLLISCGYFISGIISLIYIWKEWKIKLIRVSFNDVIVSLKESFNVFINCLLPTFYNNWSILLLGFWGGPAANGIYDGGNKFNSMGQQFMNVLSRAFFPFLARRPEKHKVYAVITLSLALIMSLVLFFGADFLVNTFLTSKFKESVLILRIMSVSQIFLALINIYGTNYLILVNKDKLLRTITVYVSIAGFSLSIPLIYYWGVIGGALTVCLTRGLLGLSSWFFAIKTKNSLSLL